MLGLLSPPTCALVWFRLPASQEATCVDVFGQCNVHLFQGLCTLGSRLQTAVRRGSGWGGSIGGPGESRAQKETYSIAFPKAFKDYSFQAALNSP